MSEDTNMQALDASIAAKEAQLHGEFRELAKGAGVTTQTLAREFELNTGAMRRAAETAAARIEYVRGDDTLPEAARVRMVREAEDAARKQLKTLEAAQGGLLTVMGKELELAALPRVPKEREGFARDEVRMMLDGSADPVRTMTQLASRHDDLAAVLIGSYGESYLRARGFTPAAAQESHSMVKTMALSAGRNSSDPQVSGAANAYFGLDKLKASAAATRSLVWSPLDKVGVQR